MSDTATEAALLKAVLAWRDKEPKPDLRGLPRVNVPALGRIRQAIPHVVGKRTLGVAYATGVRLSQPAAFLKSAGIASLAEQAAKPLPECDALAKRSARQSGWLAGGSGAVLGVAGAAGMAADAPALLLIAVRALARIGYCYGEAPSPALIAALFALASADTDEEKKIAWHAVLTAPAGGREGDAGMNEAAVRDGLERAAEREFAKQALTGSLQKLSATLVQRLGMRKVAGVLPVVGALVGGAVNIRFTVLLSEAARMGFIARRLHADGMPLAKLLQREALVAEPVRRAKSKAAPAAKPKAGAANKARSPIRKTPKPAAAKPRRTKPAKG